MNRYYIIPETRDGSELPIHPEPFHVDDIGPMIKAWLKRYERQGYFSNCRQERLSLNTISFRIAPA